jgi:hypothetical protein
MSKTLFEEAIADAKLLREAAEQNAKNAIIEAVTPRIREFIENQLVGGNQVAESDDFLQAALSEGDEEDDEDVALDETALRSLVELMGGNKKASDEKSDEKAALDEAVAMLSEEEQERLLKILQETDEESKNAKVESDGAYEINLDELKASISNEIKTHKAPHGDKNMKHMHDMEEEGLYELDEMMDDDDLDEALLKLVGTAEEREAFEKLGLSGIEFEDEAGEEEEVQVGDEEMSAAEPEGEEGAEEPAEVSEAVYEIDENMLRRELARLREAKSRKKAKGSSAASHKVAAAAFGGGTLEGDVHDVDLNKGDTTKTKLMKEARENRALRQQLNDYRGAVETLREQLSDLNLFNAKLLYVNKILQNKDVAPNQRRAIIEALDGASNLREAKLLYESLATSISSKNQSLNESVKHTAGLASRPVASSSARMSGAGEVDRWAILAGIK